MKKIVFASLISAMLVVACSATQPTPPAPAVNPQAPAVSQPTSAPAVVNATPPQPPAAQLAKPISKEFTPSNPKNVKLNAGKPQLVEFFAFW